MGLVSWINIGLDQNGFMGYPIQTNFFIHVVSLRLSLPFFLSHETWSLFFDLARPSSSITTSIHTFWVIDFGLSITTQQLIFFVSRTLFFFNLALWVTDFDDLGLTEVNFYGFESIDKLISQEGFYLMDCTWVSTLMA